MINKTGGDSLLQLDLNCSVYKICSFYRQILFLMTESKIEILTGVIGTLSFFLPGTSLIDNIF
jgi:hypothetical protein